MPSPIADPAWRRCLLVLEVANEDSLETNQAAWIGNDPFQALQAEGVRRYVRALSERSDLPLLRPRSRIGAAHFWVESEAASLDLARRLASRAMLKPHRVLRDAKAIVFPGRDHCLIDGQDGGPPGRKKSLFLVRRKEGISIAAFQNHWLEVHGALVRGTPGVDRYTQFHRLPDSYDRPAPDFDGAAELSFADLTAYEAFRRSEHSARQTADLPNLFDLRTGRRFFVNEEVVFG